MPLFPFSQAMPASGIYDPLTGWQYEYLPYPAQVEIALNAAVTEEAVATISFGAETVQEESPVQVVTLANQPPPYDQPQLVDVAAAGDRLKIRIREIAGNTGFVRGWIRIQSLI
jgi:hypothetical protein